MPDAYSPASQPGNSDMIPGQSVSDVWWTEWQRGSFYPNSSVLPCEYHSTNAANSYSFHLPYTLCNINPELDINIKLATSLSLRCSEILRHVDWYCSVLW